MKLNIGSKLALRLALAEHKQLAIMNAHAIAYCDRLVYRRFPFMPFDELELRRGLNFRHRKPQPQ